MKIYTRAKFLTLPEGVLFCKGQPWAFETLCVKGRTSPATEDYQGDFYYRDLCGIDALGSAEAFDAYDDMLKNGTSQPLCNNVMRDGLYDDNDVFLVFEQSDLDALQEIVDKARQVS